MVPLQVNHIRRNSATILTYDRKQKNIRENFTLVSQTFLRKKLYLKIGRNDGLTRPDLDNDETSDYKQDAIHRRTGRTIPRTAKILTKVSKDM